MNMHKGIRLTPHDRQQIWQMYQKGECKITRLAEIFRVSRPTIYKVLARARKQEFVPRSSANVRYRSVKYGLKRLSRVEQDLEGKRRQG
jgi:Spy/CpxP family protein refolding chaperone